MTDTAPPLARNTDEFTSHLAADEHVENGEWEKSKSRVLDAARKCHPAERYTAREFARDSGIKHEIIHKRFPDLEKIGLMFKVGHHQCEVTGKKAILWSAYPPPPECEPVPPEYEEE